MNPGSHVLDPMGHQLGSRAEAEITVSASVSEQRARAGGWFWGLEKDPCSEHMISSFYAGLAVEQLIFLPSFISLNKMIF